MPATSLVDVEAVVLDECHYMNDRQGTVWEESSTAQLKFS